MLDKIISVLALTTDRIIHSYILYIVIFTIIFSYIFTFIVKKLAFKLNYLDIPNNRKMHTDAKPLLGGFAIFCSYIIGIILYYLFYKKLLPADSFKQLLGLIIASVLVVIIGLIDDKIGLSAKIKLFFQIIAAIILINFNIKITIFIRNAFINDILTIIWIVFITNSFNLLDNMDGLSSGVAAICLFTFFVVGFGQNQSVVMGSSLILCAAILGFLPYNFSPASIFMGDTGSLLLGLNVSAIAIMGTYLNNSVLTRLPVIIPLVILFIPLYDTLSVIIIRIKIGQSIFKADKRHFSHRLVNLGLKPKYAVLIIYMATLSTGLTAALLPHVELLDALLILIHTFLIFGIIAILEWAGNKE